LHPRSSRRPNSHCFGYLNFFEYCHGHHNTECVFLTLHFAASDFVHSIQQRARSPQPLSTGRYLGPSALREPWPCVRRCLLLHQGKLLPWSSGANWPVQQECRWLFNSDRQCFRRFSYDVLYLLCLAKLLQCSRQPFHSGFSPVWPRYGSCLHLASVHCLEPSVAAEDRCRFEQGHSTILTLMVFNKMDVSPLCW